MLVKFLMWLLQLWKKRFLPLDCVLCALPPAPLPLCDFDSDVSYHGGEKCNSNPTFLLGKQHVCMGSVTHLIIPADLCWEFFLLRQVLGLFGRWFSSQGRKLCLPARMPDESV